MSLEKQELVMSKDGLRCVDCRFRKPDTELFGKRLSNAPDCECQRYADKPAESMWGDCPYYERESTE